LSPTFAINRLPRGFLPAALLALACTRINPDYCDRDIHCSGGRFCDLMTSTCLMPDAGVEVDAPVADAPPELARDAGDAAGTCATDDDCRGSVLGPTCVRGLCKKCMGANECKPSLFCAVDAGRCVECTETEGCLSTPGTPICVQNRCALCTEQPGACAAKYPDTPVCHPGGTCVECVVDRDCHSDTKPICDTDAHKCVPCTSDGQCAMRGDNAGICMFHDGGRCATTEEAIHVQNGPGCSMTPGVGGTAAMPFCFSQQGIDAVTEKKRVVVLHGPDALTNWTASPVGAPVTVVGQGNAMGQGNATIAPGAFVGIRISGGEVYLRGLTVSGGTQVGIIAENGAVLRMDRCIVTGNRGGVLVLNADFDISNTVIAANKGAVVPNTATSYGGVFLKSALGKTTVFRNNTIVDNEVIGLVCAESYPIKSLLVAGNTVQQVLGCTPTASSRVGEPPRFDPNPARPYHLTAGSPCVNNGEEKDFPPDDLDGDPRPLDGASDCGADEFRAP
jgi:Right handed beta helix region